MAGSNNKKNKLRGVTEIVNPNHKRKINESTSWVDLGSGNRPTNSTAQTFGLVDDAGFPILDSDFNQVTAAFGGLGGVESLPSQVTYIGAEGELGSVDPPTYNQLAVAGFAKPLGKYDNFIRKSAARKASQINDQLDASEKVAARANADVLMKARVEEAEKIYNDLYKQYEAEKKAVDAHNENINKKKDALIKESDKLWDKIRAKYYQGQDWGNRAYYAKTDAEMTEEYMKRGGTRIDAQMASLDKQYKDQPSLPDYPDVNDDKYWNDGLTAATGEIGVTADDEKFLKKQQTLVNLTKWMNKIGLPNDFAQWTLNYANNDMTPITKFSPGMEQQVLNLVNDKFSKNPNATVVDIQYKDYGFKFKALPTRLGLGRFTATKLDNGDIRIQDIFNVDKVATHLGAAQIVPGLQDTADRLVDISYKKRNISGVFDEGGIPIDVIIKSKKKKKKENKKLKEGKTFKNFMSSINN
jgi:hypothetical protein